MGSHLIDIAQLLFDDLLVHTIQKNTEKEVKITMSAGQGRSLTTGILINIRLIEDHYPSVKEIGWNDQWHSISTAENLHIMAYADILDNNGIQLDEARKSLNIMEQIKTRCSR